VPRAALVEPLAPAISGISHPSVAGGQEEKGKEEAGRRCKRIRLLIDNLNIVARLARLIEPSAVCQRHV
jgi:hypothetical protein